MKKLRMFIEIAIIVLMFPLAMNGLKAARAIEYIQTAPGVVTAAATTADVILVKPLFDDDVVNVASITSADTDDVPAVSAYTTGSKALTVQGLAENTTRTLYITYNYQRFDDALDLFFGYLPMFLMLSLAIHVIMQLFSGKGKF
jgi:hypothetical protein